MLPLQGAHDCKENSVNLLLVKLGLLRFLRKSNLVYDLAETPETLPNLFFFFGGIKKTRTNPEAQELRVRAALLCSVVWRPRPTRSCY